MLVFEYLVIFVFINLTNFFQHDREYHFTKFYEFNHDYSLSYSQYSVNNVYNTHVTYAWKFLPWWIFEYFYEPLCMYNKRMSSRFHIVVDLNLEINKDNLLFEVYHWKIRIQKLLKSHVIKLSPISESISFKLMIPSCSMIQKETRNYKNPYTTFTTNVNARYHTIIVRTECQTYKCHLT